MHWFLDPITKQYADFSGRATRQEFWMFVLFHAIFMVGLLVLLGIAWLADAIRFREVWAVLALVNVALIVPSLAITVRRLHDTGRSGWWILLGFIPYVGSLVVIILCALQSQSGNNAYGPGQSSQGTNMSPLPVAPSSTVATNPTGSSH